MIPNKIKHSEDNQTVEVTITRHNGDQHVALFDAWLWPLLSKFNFYLHETRHRSGKFYVATYFEGKLLLAHRIIMEPFLTSEFPEVDHISHGPNSTLDNRVRNLRTANRFDQMRNTAKNFQNHDVPTRAHYRQALHLPFQAALKAA